MSIGKIFEAAKEVHASRSGEEARRKQTAQEFNNAAAPVMALAAKLKEAAEGALVIDIYDHENEASIFIKAYAYTGKHTSANLNIVMKSEKLFFTGADHFSMTIHPYDRVNLRKRSLNLLASPENQRYWKPSYTGRIDENTAAREIGEFLGRVLKPAQVAMIEVKARAATDAAKPGL
ncbi:MAG TPA: hypothetical protein VIF12_02240 [Micavibrio sp.]